MSDPISPHARTHLQQPQPPQQQWAGPQLAAAQAEVERLQKRLGVSDEWNVRLQTQIQELLRLPCNEVREMRERMHNPDIAIPLLQCYDAAIQEKAEENGRLSREVMELRARTEAAGAEQGSLNNAVRVAEELATHVQERSTAELRRMQASLQEAREEVGRLRQEMSRAMDAESAAKVAAERAQRQGDTLRMELEKANVDKAAVEEALQVARHKLSSASRTAGEEDITAEAARVKVSILTKENEGRLMELEELRARMVQALRQASDNHAAHLRVIGERHRLAIEELQGISRTHELEVQKLRAQLARVDPSNPAGSAHRHGGPTTMHTATTTELLEVQARQTQEMELKRLYAELSAMQVQRDDAVLRYEQLTSTVRRDRDEQALHSQREVKRLQKRVEDSHARASSLESDNLRLKADLHTLRDKLQTAQQELEQTRRAQEALSQEVLALTRSEEAARGCVSEAQSEAKEQAHQERQRAEALERRVTEVLDDLRAAQERANAEVEAMTRQKGQLQKRLVDAQQALEDAHLTAHTHQRERGVAETQLTRLNEALNAHKRQITASEAQVQQLQQQLEESQRQKRSLGLIIEQLKVENGRLVRSRDRLTEGLQTRVM